MENLIGQMESLETDYTEKEHQNRQITRQINKETRLQEVEELREQLDQDFGGYTITLTDSPSERPSTNNKRYGTFNRNINQHLSVPSNDDNELVDNLIKIVQKVLRTVIDQSEIIHGQEKIIENIDKDFEKLQKQQIEILKNDTLMRQQLDANTTDFEDHWKLTQQVIQDNNELHNEVTMLKKVEIASLKQLIMQRSAAVMTERPTIGQSTQSRMVFAKHDSQQRVDQSLFS